MAARDLLAAARALRIAIGAGVRDRMTPTVIGLAMIRAESDPAVAARLDAWNIAS